jgi:exodeoxyribonuclease VII large subunit
LRRPLLPKAIGVVTAETGAARRDLVAGLARRGWEGTLVWAFAPVQDRRAAPAITAAIQELAARPEIEAIVVTRGGGSLADLWAFCDETLCRTVALLRVPVVSAVGHERDTTLIDDVAAVACSTPTHAAEAAVRLDCVAARAGLQRSAGRLRRAGEGAIGVRARHLGALARGPARALQRERGALNQKIREIRAASERGLAERLGFQRRIATVVLGRARQRGIEGAAAATAAERQRGAVIERSANRSLQRRREALRKATLTLRAHEPERTLERGYALAETADGEPVTSAAAAVAAAEVRLRFADGGVKAKIEGEG